MNDAEKNLVEALRSGEYLQTDSMLRNSDDNFCCLGVACDLSNLGFWDLNELSYLEEEAFLPDSVRVHLEWAHEDGLTHIPTKDIDEGSRRQGYYSLTDLNDSYFTFDQIADIIEAGLVRHIGEEYQYGRAETAQVQTYN